MEKMNRYPGSRPFTKEYQSLFFGRNQDIKQLHRHINAHKITVLYGKSGLGKSSLLNAGVVPLLQEHDNYLPYFIRFNNCSKTDTEDYISPLQIFNRHISAHDKKENILHVIENEHISIWQQFKHLQLQNPKIEGILLVFDQFEELFTYRDEDVAEFGKELAELLNNRVPLNFKRTLYQKYKEDKAGFAKIGFSLPEIESPIEIRMVCSIRADRMSWMQKITNHVPNILRNCVELKPLNKKQAIEAITLPAALTNAKFSSPAFKYENETIENILTYLSTGHSENIEPFQLQLICQFIEEGIVLGKGKTTISSQDIGDLKEITHDYYKNIIQRFPESRQLDVRRFVEDGLVFEEENRRTALLEGQIIRQFSIDKQDLAELVNSHLLRAELNTSNLPIYELSHDALIAPILDFKRERKADEQRIALIKKQDKEKKRFLAQQAERRKKTINRVVIGGVSLGLLGFLGISTFLASKNQEIATLLKNEKTLNQELAQMKMRAEASRDTAMFEKIMADSNANLAKLNALLAIKNEKNALKQRKLAEHNALLAKSNEQKAELNAEEANAERLKVEEERIKVQNALEEIKKLKDSGEVMRKQAESSALELTSQRELAEQRLSQLTKLQYASQESLTKAQAELETQKKKEKDAWDNAKKTKANFLMGEAERVRLQQPVQAMRLIEAAYKLYPQDVSLKYMQEIYGDNPVSFSTYSARFPDKIITIKPINNSDLFLIATENGMVQLRDMQGDIVKEVKRKEESLIYVDYSRNNGLFLILDNKGLHLYQDNGTEILKLKDKNATKARFSSDGNHLAYLDTKGEVFISDIYGKRNIKLKHGDKQPFSYMYYANSGNVLFTLSVNGLIQSWDSEGKMLSEFQCNENITRIKPSSDGNFVIAVTQNKYIKLWNSKGELYATFENSSDVLSVDFSPEESFIIAGCQDGCMRIWDVPTKKTNTLVPLIRYHYPHAVYSARFAPNFTDSKKVCIGANNYLYIQHVNQEDILNWLSKSKLAPLDPSLKKKYDLD